MNTTQEEPLYELSTDRELLEIQGVTFDKNHLHIIGIYAFICIIPCALLNLWFHAGVISLSFVCISVLQDIRGRQGWVRGLLLKHCGKNIISWYPERIPVEANKIPDVVPSVIIALPYTKHKHKNWPLWIVFFICSFLVLLPFISNLTTPSAYVWCAGILFTLTLTCFALPHTPKQYHSQSIHQHNHIQKVWFQKERTRRLVVLLYEDGINGGGISTFLRNYEDFIPPDQSFLVCLKEGPLKYSLPSFLFGTRTPAQFVKSILPESTTSTPSTIQATYTYGWSSFIVHTPFSDACFEELFSLIDVVE